MFFFLKKERFRFFKGEGIICICEYRMNELCSNVGISRLNS